MAIPDKFVKSLVRPSNKEIGTHIAKKTLPKLAVVVEIYNELKPDTLF